MASPYFCVFLAIFLLLESVTTESLSDRLAPIFSPITDDVCKGIECGKGTCKPSSSSTFFFECECDSGWKHTTSENSDHFKFLPCVIPNCSLDYSCAEAPAPISDKSNKSNTSFFDPCYWMDCGGGTCNKTSKLAYNCECGEGYYNLLNVTTFPCFKECAIGMDCTNLGISVSNKSTSPPTPALADNGKNHGEEKKQNGLCKPWDLSYSYRLSNVESIFSAFFFSCTASSTTHANSITFVILMMFVAMVHRI